MVKRGELMVKCVVNVVRGTSIFVNPKTPTFSKFIFGFDLPGIHQVDQQEDDHNQQHGQQGNSGLHPPSKCTNV